MLLLPVRLSLPSLKMLLVRDSLKIRNEVSIFAQDTTLAAAKQTKLFNCFIPNTMVFSHFFAAWRKTTENLPLKV